MPPIAANVLFPPSCSRYRWAGAVANENNVVQGRGNALLERARAAVRRMSSRGGKAAATGEAAAAPELNKRCSGRSSGTGTQTKQTVPWLIQPKNKGVNRKVKVK